MSDQQAAEEPGVWSPADRPGSAGGVGRDGLGEEGSQAASSGTQGRDAGRGAAHRPRGPALRCQLRRARGPRPGQPLGARAGLGSPRGRDPLCRRRCPHPGPALRSRVFSAPVSKCLGSCPAAYPGRWCRGCSAPWPPLSRTREPGSESHPHWLILPRLPTRPPAARPCFWLLTSPSPAPAFPRASAPIRAGSLASFSPRSSFGPGLGAETAAFLPACGGGGMEGRRPTGRLRRSVVEWTQWSKQSRDGGWSGNGGDPSCSEPVTGLFGTFPGSSCSPHEGTGGGERSSFRQERMFVNSPGLNFGETPCWGRC